MSKLKKEDVEKKLEELEISWNELQKFVLGYNDYTKRFNPDSLWEQAVLKIELTGEFPNAK